MSYFIYPNEDGTFRMLRSSTNIVFRMPVEAALEISDEKGAEIRRNGISLYIIENDTIRLRTKDEKIELG